MEAPPDFTTLFSLCVVDSLRLFFRVAPLYAIICKKYLTLVPITVLLLLL